MTQNISRDPQRWAAAKDALLLRYPKRRGWIRSLSYVGHVEKGQEQRSILHLAAPTNRRASCVLRNLWRGVLEAFGFDPDKDELDLNQRDMPAETEG